MCFQGAFVSDIMNCVSRLICSVWMKSRPPFLNVRGSRFWVCFDHPQLKSDSISNKSRCCTAIVYESSPINHYSLEILRSCLPEKTYKHICFQLLKVTPHDNGSWSLYKIWFNSVESLGAPSSHPSTHPSILPELGIYRNHRNVSRLSSEQEAWAAWSKHMKLFTP